MTMWRRAAMRVAAGPTSHRAVAATAGVNARAGLSPRLECARSPIVALGRPLSGSTRTPAPTTEDGGENDPLNPLPPSMPFLDRVVDKLNGSIKKYPGDTLAVLFASDIGSIGAMYGLLSVSGIEFSPEFALAFAASRPFRRFRLPLDLAVAAAVSKAVPAFSKVRLSDLAGAIPTRQSSVASTSEPPKLFASTMAKAKDIVDSYGAAYMMGSRLAGVGVVCVLHLLIKQGVDVMPILAKLGVEEVGTALGAYAAAVVFSSALYPVTLGVTGYVVPVVAKARRAIMP